MASDAWVDPTVCYHIALSGGRSGKTWALPVQEEVVMPDGTVLVFVTIRKDLEWLYKSVRGPHAQNGCLSEVKIIQVLRDKAYGLLSSDADKAAVAADDDPMNLLDDVDDDDNGALLTPTKPPSKRRRPNRCNIVTPLKPHERVCTITMSDHNPMRYPALSDTTRDITLLQGEPHRSATVNKNFKLAIKHDDVPWLLRWMNDELYIACLSAVADVPALPGLRLEWNGGSQQWSGIFHEGPLFGEKDTVTYVRKLTRAKWDIVHAIHNYGVEFDDAQFPERKQATRDYLIYILSQRHGAVVDRR